MKSGTVGVPFANEHDAVQPGTMLISSSVPRSPPTVTIRGALTVKPGRARIQVVRSREVVPTPGSGVSGQAGSWAAAPGSPNRSMPRTSEPAGTSWKNVALSTGTVQPAGTV